MPFAAALSEHPVGAEAVGEVVGSVLDQLGPEPDLAVLFATPPHREALQGIAAAVRELLAPKTLLAAAAVSVLAGDREVEEAPALSLWAGRLGQVTPVRLEVVRTTDGPSVVGMPDVDAPAGKILVLVPDPFSFPADTFLTATRELHPGLAMIGGLASAADAPGGNVLVLDGQTHRDGAIGALVDPDVDVDLVVSQGCRPIGAPYVVTRADRNIAYELGGVKALDRLMAILDALEPEDQQLASRGLHVGHAIDESKLELGRGDFLIRGVLGADKSTGAVAFGDEVEVGSLVQFQVRDAASADEDLRLLLDGRRADGALVFTCNGRGSHLFGSPDHDAQVVSEMTETRATGGMFCAGEVGPVGDRNFLHGFTASMALFRDHS